MIKYAIDEVLDEVDAQLGKWGEQNHPSIDTVLLNREGGCTPDRMCEEYEIPTENRAKFLCDMASNKQELTWTHIAVEELSEVVCAADDKTRRGELVQLAAVILNWIDSIDRNAV